MAKQRQPGVRGDGNPATGTGVYAPYGLAVDHNGNIFIAVMGNNAVREVHAGSGVITTVAGTGAQISGGDGGAAIQAQLDRPCALAIDARGNLYIAECGGNMVREVDAGTGIIHRVAGTGAAGYTGDGGPARQATLHAPSGLTLDRAGNLYIADPENNVVRKVDAASGTIATIAGTGAADMAVMVDRRQGQR